MPYPNPVNEEGCDWSLLTADEHRFLSGFVTELNAVIASEAAQRGFYFADKVTTAFGEAHLRICDDTPKKVGMNFFAANPVAGVVEQSVNPRNWIHNSFHPNKKGHDALQATIASWIRANPAPTPRTATPRRLTWSDPSRASWVGTTSSTAGRLRRTRRPRARFCEYDEHGLIDVGEWKRMQLAALLKTQGWAVVVWLSGAWICWIVVIWARRRWVSTHA